MDNKILVNDEHENASPEVASQLDAAQKTINEAMEMAKATVAAQSAPTEEAPAVEDGEEITVSEVPEGVTVAVENEVSTSSGEEKISFFKTTKWKRIWDKITTGLLIAVMAIPVAILTYILLWFLLK